MSDLFTQAIFILHNTTKERNKDQKDFNIIFRNIISAI